MKIQGWKVTAVCSAVLLFWLGARPAEAQYRAGIQGSVVDVNGGTVPGATVTLTSKETNATRTATTSDEGVYTFPGLAPGRYSMTVEKTGFTKKVLQDVQVGAEQMMSVNVQLELGQVSETINVEGSVAPVVETQTANVGGTITNREVERLPSIGRDPFQLLRLAPGVFGNGAIAAGGGAASLPGSNVGAPSVTDSIFKVENGAQITANGTRQNSNNFQVDGVSVNSTSWGGAAVITPNEESIKEVRVVANNYSAENGRTSGAQVMVVSQNGTNDLHGSAFFKWHRPGLNAYQRWNGPGAPVTRDVNRFNQFGGSLGGPLWKNKLFAFFSYETLRNNSFNQGTSWYETPQFLQNAGANGSIARTLLSYPGEAPSYTAIIPRTCAQVGLPSTQCRDVSGGLDLGSPLTIGAKRLDPTYGAAGTPYGIGGGFDGIPDAMFLQTRSPNLNTSQQFNGRLDYNLSSVDLLAFSIYYVPVDTHTFNGPARAANAWNHSSIAESWTAIYTRTISATMLNEARVGRAGWNWNEFESNPQEPWGLPTASFWAAGSVGLQQFGAPGFSIFDQKTYNIRDTLSKVQGSHNLKFGADISLARHLDTAPWSARPNYDFRNLWEFANDAPFHENANFDPVTGKPTAAQKNLRFNILAFFVQDDWKVKPNLTLNLGLRYERFGPLTEENGNLSNVVLGQGGSALTGLRIRKGGSLFDTSNNNWGPQLGFAWTPGRQSRLVLRGGFGIGYNLQQLAITSNGRFNPPFMVALDLYGSNILYSTNSDVKQFTNWPSNPAAVQQFDATSGLPTSGAPVTLTGFPSFMPSTVTYRYSFDAQYALGGNWMTMLGYQGSQSRHYTRQSRWDWIYWNAENPRVQNLTWYANDANAHYNAMTAQLQHRFARNFEFDFQYRFSRSVDQGSQDYAFDPYPWNSKYSVGPSDYDVTHLFKLWGVWTPQLFRNRHGWAGSLLGGWTISGIITAHSGFPWTPGYTNTGGNVVYPNSGYYNALLPASYNGKGGSDQSNSTFQQPNGNFPNGALSYFTVPTWPALGQYPAPGAGVHRNMLRGPRYFGNDVSVAKAFGVPRTRLLGENARLNLQANIYNLVNKLNVTNLNTTISNDGTTSNPQFGQAQGAFAGRIIELQARFSF